jgi:hypothetical protein
MSRGHSHDVAALAAPEQPAEGVGALTDRPTHAPLAEELLHPGEHGRFNDRRPPRVDQVTLSACPAF